jgi:hypothetical protein
MLRIVLGSFVPVESPCLLLSKKKRRKVMANEKAKAKVTLDQVIEACEADDCRGFCLGCGAEAYNVEPDSRRYLCES